MVSLIIPAVLMMMLNGSGSKRRGGYFIEVFFTAVQH